MYMDSILEPSYKRSFAFIIAVTSLFCLFCSFGGYIALPFAAAFYATLLTYEKREKRIFSYLIPIIFFIINFAINGLFSLEGIAYVVIGSIIYFAYKRGLSKGETALYVTAATFLMIILSLLFVAFYAVGKVDLGLAIDYYSDIINAKKGAFVEFMSTNKNKEIINGIPFTPISVSEAEVFYDAVILLLFPTLVITAFFLAGLTFKTFSLNLKHFSVNKEKITKWRFGTNNFLAYIYIIVTVLNIFTSASEEIYAVAISFIALVLSVIYAYLGFKFLLWVLTKKFNTPFCLILLIGLILLFGTYAVNILSFVGVYYTLASNSILANGDSENT